jgi:replication fork protection complex subunit Tof1/Swi1
MGAAASSTSSSVKPIAGADNPEILAETADILQQQLVYNGEVLDLALDALRAYRPGTQSLAYLDGAVHLAWALLRVLEKWTKGGSISNILVFTIQLMLINVLGSVGKEMVVRRKARAKKKKATGQSTEEGDGVPDVPDEEEEALARADEEREEERREAVFTFEAFEMV